MKINVKKYMIITILIAFFVCISYTYSDAMVVTTYADSPTPNKKLSKPKITIVKIDSIKNQTKAYNRICMSDEYEANNVQIYRKINNGKWKKIKTVKYYNGDYVGNRFVVYTDKVNKTKKNTKYKYRVKCNGDGWSRSKKYTNYSSTKSSTIGKKSFKIQLKNAATNRVYNTSYVRYGGKYTAPANGQATTGYTFTGWTTKSLKNIKKGYIITAKYRVNSYTVTFKNGINSNTIATITRNYNSQIGDFPAAPSVSGYTFTGWSGGTSSTRVTGNMTITANYNVTTPKQMQNITASNMTINVGQSQNIGATVNSGLTLTYTSNDASIASVNSNGLVTGNKAGNTTITIKQAGNSQYNAATKNITVTVNNTTTNNSFEFTNTPSKVFTRPATENRDKIWNIEFKGSNIRNIQWSLEDYKNGFVNSPGGASTVNIYNKNTISSPLKIESLEDLDSNNNAGKFKVVANVTFYDGSTRTEKSSMITNTVYKEKSSKIYNNKDIRGSYIQDTMYFTNVPNNSKIILDFSEQQWYNNVRFAQDARFISNIDRTCGIYLPESNNTIKMIDNFIAEIKYSRNGSYVTQTLEFTGQTEKQKEYKKELSIIAAGCQNKTTDMDKVKYIIKYIRNTYSYSSSYGSGIDMVYYGQGDCVSYAELFRDACLYQGITAYKRDAFSSQERAYYAGSGHRNNAVIIDNNKYVVDTSLSSGQPLQSFTETENLINKNYFTTGGQFVMAPWNTYQQYITDTSFVPGYNI